MNKVFLLKTRKALPVCILFCLSLSSTALLEGCERKSESSASDKAQHADIKTSGKAAPSSAGRSHEIVKETRPLMGTMVEITAIGRDRARVREAVIKAFAEMKRIESLMSPYRKGSDIRRINRAAGKTPVKVDAEVIKLLSRSRKVSEKSGGAFDLTAAALGGIWSFDKKSPEIPSESEIKKTLKKVGFDLLVLDREKETAQLSLPGMRIHPGGIAKGYACDRAARLLAEEDVSMAMVNAGGDIRVLGRKINRPWKVGLQDPRDPRRIMAWIPVKNAAVATSGDYEKFFVKDGKRYCHIMDPGTGRPANVCRSATVITDEAWLADTLATAVFVLGPEEGLELVHEMDAKALVIDAAGETHLSPVLKGKVHWLQ